MTVPHAKIRGALRKLWLWSPERRDAKKRARYDKGVYVCEACGSFTREPEIDHRVPVGPTPGARKAPPEATWDGLIGRLFVPAEALEVLCRSCHAARTKAGRAS